MGKNFRKRKNGFKKFNKLSSMLIAKKALRKVNKLVRSVEWKSKDSGIVTASIDTVGTVTQQVTIAQGDGESARDGLNITVQKLNFNISVLKNGSATDTRVRCIIYVDKRQESDAKQSPAEVLETSTTLSHLNHTRVKRYRILKDRIFNLRTNMISIVARWSFRFKTGLKQRYNGALVTDIEQNGIYILLLSNEGTNQPSFSYNARMYYTDL